MANVLIFQGRKPFGRTSPPTETASPEPDGKRYVPPANDMSWLHQMKTLECVDCGHDWIQPSPTGLCPKCRSEKTRVILERVNSLPRV